PAQKLGCQAHVLSLLADGERKLAVINHNFQMLLARFNDCDAADLGRLQSFLREHDGIFVKFNDVDFLAAQLADDRLHAHALQAHAGAHGVHILIFGHDRDLGALSGFTGDGTDLHRAIVNFRYLGLEQVLHQFRRSARDDNGRSLGVLVDPGQHHAHALADGERLQPRLLLLRHLGFRLTNVEDHVRTLHALHRSVDELAYAPDVLVVNGVALRFTDFLKDDLLGDLRRDAAQSFRGLQKAHFAADFSVGVDHLGLVQGNLDLRILNVIFRGQNALYRVYADIA